MCPAGSEFEDRHAEFLIAVADLCSAAQLAGLWVEVLITSGARIRGVPASLRRAAGDDELDSTGYARTFRVDGAVVNMDDVLECTVYAPAQRP